MVFATGYQIFLRCVRKKLCIRLSGMKPITAKFQPKPGLIILLALLALAGRNGISQSLKTQDTLIKQHSPHKATLYSAMLPGLGQAYNRKYWKVPVIYVGFATIGYFVDMNTKEYRKFKEAYNYKASGDSTWTNNEYVFKYSQSSLLQGRNYYRRNMELSYILGAALYFLNIIDAAVDAHLLDFDVGEDLSLRVQPSLLPQRPGEPLRGSISFSLQF